VVAIPAGNFLMGSDTGAEDEKPVHHVVLEAFSMSKHEVTVEQYRVFALSTGRPAPQYRDEEGNQPATNVSWDDAIAYTQWLSKKTRRLFRLPTESEWEYSARAGTTSEYFTGDSLLNAANCVGCDDRWGGKSVSPVGSFDPNEFGCCVAGRGTTTQTTHVPAIVVMKSRLFATVASAFVWFTKGSRALA